LTREATGPRVSGAQLRRALENIRQAYRDRGYQGATVKLPRQVIADEVLLIQISEGNSPSTPAPVLPAPTVVPRPVASPAGFVVRGYEVMGNSLLSTDRVTQILSVGTGTNVTLPQIQKALADLQLAYRERGFATVSVALPQQRLTNAVVRVQVTEGLLADIRVTGNHYFSSNNVRRSLPSLQTNVLLNSRVFQSELDAANQHRDRQIYPSLGPGPDPGTSALTLRVEDRLPLHGRLEINNYSSPGTPDWRINASLQYANLWQREHQVGLSYGFTPEQMKDGGLVPDRLFNQPLVAYYGAFYRWPLGATPSVQDGIDHSGGRFGYDESTRQFRVPPAAGRPDLTVYFSGSSSDTGVKVSDPRLVTETPLLTIRSQDSGQNIMHNEVGGLRWSIPGAWSERHRWNVAVGIDAKATGLRSYNTNLFPITTVITNAQGSQTIETLVASAQPLRRQELFYLPASLDLGWTENDATGTTTVGLGLSYSLFGSGYDRPNLTNEISRSVHYTKTTLAVMRDQRLARGWSVVGRASGQWASGALINQEQFALGGQGSVRGYFEGDEYGDAGWFGGLELRTPTRQRPFPTPVGEASSWWRGFVFLEGGQRFLLGDTTGLSATESLLGTGLGVSAGLSSRLDMRVQLAWPLLDSRNTRAFDPHASLMLGGQF